MLSADDYKKLTDPESVALVGVTSRTGKGSNNPLEVILDWGYKGRIYPINPKGGVMLGHNVYTSLLDVPEIPDIAVLCAPRDSTPELFLQCCLKNIKLVIIVAQGFYDGDAPGRAMQDEILRNAAEHGVRILGPNTLGIVNNFSGFCTSFLRFINPKAATGIMCQSGVFVVGAPSVIMGIGLLIDTGNTADLEYSEMLGHMARDPRIKVISLHLESLQNGAAFIEAAKDAIKLKPVIVYKTGISPFSATIAGSHTGKIAGEYKVFEAVFKQCRLLTVQDVEELNDYNKVFNTFNGIKGNKIGIVSISGGGGIMAADACAKHGLEVASLSPRTYELIGDMFPSWAHCSNPADVWPVGMFHGYHKAYRSILEAFLKDPNIDAVICISGSILAPEDDFINITSIVRELAKEYPDKPIVAFTCGDQLQRYAKEFEEDGDVLYFYSVDRAARALSALYRYHYHCKIDKQQPAIAADKPLQNQPSYLLADKRSGNLSQIEVFKLLESYQIPIARWAKAATFEDAATAAAEIGYPVVMKVLSPSIIHKTDSGGVRLDIRDKQELENAYAEMHESVAQEYPDAVIEGTIIQEYLNKGTEVILGSKYDPHFGPVLAFGSGGVYTEIMDDVALRVPPLSEAELEEMIMETKIGKILSGARGAKPADKNVLVKHIKSFITLVLENPSIAEMDINPLLVSENRVIALDARIALK